MKSIRRRSSVSVALPALLLGLVSLGHAPAAWAHQDPPACTGAGVNLQVFVFRADGTTDATGQSFTPCETAKYKARVCHSGGTVCNIEGDALTTWTITTPDGSIVNVMPGGGIPLLATGTCVDSMVVTYVVNVPGPLNTDTNVKQLINHTGPGGTNTRSNASTGISNDVDPCPPSTACLNSFCDPSSAFGAFLERLGHCVTDPVPNSTQCPDIDGNACTMAGCDGQGNCDQAHVGTPCPLDACNTGQCDPGTGLCIPVPFSTPCPDTDGNACTVSGCDGAGACDQRHVLPNSTPCPDTGNECAAAGCDGAGACDQNHVPAPSSTPCADTDQNTCTIAGCNGNGVCDQQHVLPNSTPCPDTGNECAAAGCNGAGACDQNHVPAPNSTPCTDTDQNTCTIAGCDGNGTCDQRHVLPNSTPCPDTGNDCAAAGCDGAGSCDQNHVPAPNSTPCTDSDGNVCTIAGCNGAGVCDQSHINAPNSTPCPDSDGQTCTTPGCNGQGSCDQQHVVDCQGPPDHYTCYNSATSETNPPDVTLVDQFESASFHPKRCHPKSFCTPSGKNGSQITDPATHLKGYKIRRIGGAEPRVTVDVTNQFGTVRLTTKKSDRLLVPSAKSLTASPPPPDPQAQGNQHYKCYRVSAVSFAPVTVTVADQFGTKQLQLRKIVSLCTPVSKNGSVIKDPTRHLLCYSVRPVTQPPSPVFVSNQFGSQTVNLSREGAFCVPSTKTIVP